MTRFSQWTMGAVMAALVVLAAPGGAVSADLASQVQAAKTAAEHETLAAEYSKQAAAAKEAAAMHRRMGEAYKGQPATSGGKVAGSSTMPAHCASLAKSFDDQAAMYESMAATERELAKTAR